jgi:hypothetical protein
VLNFKEKRKRLRRATKGTEVQGFLATRNPMSIPEKAGVLKPR